VGLHHVRLKVYAAVVAAAVCHTGLSLSDSGCYNPEMLGNGLVAYMDLETMVLVEEAVHTLLAVEQQEEEEGLRLLVVQSCTALVVV